MTETEFAASIFNAEQDAAVARKHGLDLTTADVVAGIVAEESAILRSFGYSRDTIESFVSKYVDADGMPRPFHGRNLVRLRLTI